jgi:hypothetical protein
MPKAYQFKKGMQLHPFSDQSGVALYNAESTALSSVKASMVDIKKWLQTEEDLLKPSQVEVIQELLQTGLIELVEE